MEDSVDVKPCCDFSNNSKFLVTVEYFSHAAYTLKGLVVNYLLKWKSSLKTYSFTIYRWL